MGKPKRENEIRIMVNPADELPEPNSTLLALLRDGEKPKPGEPGTLADRLGGVVQDFLRKQVATANHNRAPVKGTITLKLNFVTGPDGSHAYTCKEAVKLAEIVPRPSVVFADEEGELLSRPAEPLTELAYKRQKDADETKPAPTVKPTL